MKKFLAYLTARQTFCAVLILILSICITVISFANDTEVSIAAGGIQPKRDVRISMEKERLFISKEKVTVDYDFLNESNADITAEVGFPIPPLSCVGQEYCPGQVFDDFKATSDGRDIALSLNVRALVGGRDYSVLLRKFHIDIATFGHFDPTGDGNNADFSKLTKGQEQELLKNGLFNDSYPSWSVEKTYYWSQTFPAHKMIHVSHEYHPISGYSGVEFDELDQRSKDQNSSGFDLMLNTAIRESCFDASLLKALKQGIEARGEANGGYAQMLWVNYILTTANSWKTPIKDFSLVVEKPPVKGGAVWFASFCWDGKVERIDPGHFIARAKNFVPKRELTVAFIRPM